MIFWCLIFTACTSPHSKPYTLQAPAAQSGPQHILLGQDIDINSADATAIEALPGVGPALAQRIVEYRSANGPFVAIRDLQKVSGIGEKMLQKLSPLVQISPKP